MAYWAIRNALHMSKKCRQADIPADIIVGAAYSTWELELQKYREELSARNFNLNQLHSLNEIKNTYDEAERAVGKAIELEATHLVVVAEKWHARRSESAFKNAIKISDHPDLRLTVHKFNNPFYQRLLEPSKLKSWRASHEWSWALWNKLLEFVPASIIKKMM